MEQQDSLVIDDQYGASELYTGIVVERTDDMVEYRPSLNLEELWVFGLPDFPQGTSFALLEVSPRRWATANYIELPATIEAIDLIVKSDEGEALGFLLRIPKIPHEYGRPEKMEMFDGRMQLSILREVEEELSESSEGDDDLVSQLNEVGVARLHAFEQTGELADINDGILMLQQAVDLTHQDDDDLLTLLNNLAGCFMRRFQRTGDLSDITEAISGQKRVVEHTPQGHANLPRHLTNLGCTLMRRFQRTGQLSDINEAISQQRRAVELTPPECDGELLADRLSNLGGSFTCRFNRTGEVSDITEAILLQQRAVKLTPQGHASLPSYLNILGVSLNSRFERTGDLSDVTEAISVQQRAVKLTPQGHADLPSYLSNVGGSFMSRFERTGEASDIIEAISVHQRAVEITPQGHPALPSYLNNLGSAFMRRFQRTGELSDIAEAISMLQRAVKHTLPGHASLHMFLSNLGGLFMCRFEQTDDLSDVAEAISAQQMAVGLTPQDHVSLPGYLNNLGCSFRGRFERTGELSDVTEAISVHKRAVKLAPQGHAALPSYLNSLGGSLIRRFEEMDELSDITEAISVQQTAVRLTPQGHASLPTYLLVLGASIYSRFISTGSDADLGGAICQYKSAAISTVGSPKIRLDAARRWADVLLEHDPHSPDIIPSFDTALGLVALIAGLEQTVRGRFTQLEKTTGLALQAASAACALDRADKALEWLEQGRCFVWSQLNNLRTPLDELRAHNPDLARSIADIARQLENAGSSREQFQVSMSMAEKMTLEEEARAQSDLARQWNDLLETTRAIPGFESFLTPPPCHIIMQNLPDLGPIVVINIDENRCDALTLMDGLHEPLHVPLPNFSLGKATEYRDTLASQLRSRHLRVRQEEYNPIITDESSARGMRPAPGAGGSIADTPVHRVLRGLWEDVVKPILDALGFSRIDTASEVPPRLWWCPTGPLSFLPLHAAGVYCGTNPESTLDYVVSSYTPSVTAITDRVKNCSSINAKALGLFLTSQPNAPDASSIPGTTTEVQAIFSAAKERRVRVEKLEGDAMKVSDCLERMQDFSSIHFACHGSQNAAEPLQSRFLFHQGSLSLQTILQYNLPNADLAFLSACQTSTGEAKLSDEAVHLTAGMLAAGYRRVVGTMWSIGDKAAQELATAFYEYLFTHRDDTTGLGFNGTLSAHALHHATQQLRCRLNDSELSLLTWVPFVHFGY